MSAVHSVSPYSILFHFLKKKLVLTYWIDFMAHIWAIWKHHTGNFDGLVRVSLILLEDNNTHTKAFKPSSLYPEQKTWAWEQFMWKQVQFSLKSVCKNTTMWGQKAHCPAPSGILHSLLGAIFNRHQQPETCSEKTVKVEKHLKLLGTRNV